MAKTWQSVETGLLMSAKYGYEILNSGDSWKVVFTGKKEWNAKFKQVRYYSKNPQQINFGLTVRGI